MEVSSARGFTLVEFLIVIALAGALSAMALTRGTSKDLEIKLAVTKDRVQLVQLALDGFIRAGCKSGVRTIPTIPALVAGGYLEDASVATSLFDGSSFTVHVDWPAYWQVVRVNLSSPEQAQAYFGGLAGNRVEGSDVVWERAFNNHTEADAEGAKQFRAMFEDECN